MGHSKIVGAIEIGTSKIAIIIGEISSGASLNIIGNYSVQSSGVKKGVIEDLQATGQIVHSAIVQAENEAGTEIEEIYLAHTGQHLPRSSTLVQQMWVLQMGSLRKRMSKKQKRMHVVLSFLKGVALFIIFKILSQ